MRTVLDTSALLAFAFGEPGADRVAEALDHSRMSAVNLAEVATKLMERGASRKEFDLVWALVSDLSEDFTAPQASLCGRLRPTTRGAGLSLGDRACIALAQELGAPILTADRAWAGLDVGVDIVVIR